MRPDIPWNVAGIPPEAREAARAAARREGLSVGEWMTRRILRSFSDAPEDIVPTRESWSGNGHDYAPEPQAHPAPTRRDTEDMLAHVARSESESGQVFRRIEEQLRGVARRLEATERSNSENNRAMSKAATEINIAAREQSQAFDQLGSSVVGLADRIDRVERVSQTDGMKDAVKGLHQGLSRLADQISETANQSATQISSLASNLESVAGRLGQARSEADATTRAFEQRIAQIDERVRGVERSAQMAQASLQKATESNSGIFEQRISHIDDRMRGIENAVQHAVSGIEARKDDDASALRRDAETASAIARLEDNLSHLEARGPDPAIDRRLSGIERSLSDIAGRFDKPDATATLVEDNIKRLAQRLEASEARQRDSLSELRTAMSETAGRIAAVETIPQGLAGADQGNPFAQHQAFDTPPFADMAHPDAANPFQTSADPFAGAGAFDAGAAAFGTEAAFGNSGFATDPFAAAPPPPPLSEQDSYLSAARRSARAAAAQAEAERGTRSSGFSWGAAATDTALPPKVGGRKTTLWIAIIVVLAVVAIGAGAILSQKISSNSAHTAGALFNKPTDTTTTPTRPTGDLLPPSDATVTPPAQTAIPPSAPTSPALHPATHTPSGVHPLETHNVPPATVHTVPTPPAATTPPPATTTPPPAQTGALSPLDKLTALANGGNAKAELVVGLKYLDGDGVAVNEADAAKWLERAAEQGMPVAQYRLGTMYEHGRGVPADPVKAVHWYSLAAQAGNRKAMHNLAVAYASGSGIAKNLPEAARWFSKAASLGLSDSEFNLAVLYERGLGVPQSLLDAYKWYAIAAAAGDAESKTRIDALTTQLSADDRAAAQHSADAFHPQPLDPRANVPPQMSDVAG